ncbi:MAG TPA: hypothetical protein VMB71_12030 [Acetobacteraceae bacterium]|nr:hypothetical protein [Acetobacteraceae bacterium]
MPKPTVQNDRITRAEFLARDTAPDIAAILITHYPDAETLDIFRPGETDLATALAVNRTVASVMLEAGVEVLVQRADRGAFRRWISDRDDTAENRRAWIDRNRLLRGAAALQTLSLNPAALPSAQPFGKAPGPIADGLLAAFDDEDEESDEFDVLVQGLMEAGRTDVLDLAVRKLGERDGDEAGDWLDWVLREAAEAASVGPSGSAELVALVVALPAAGVPDGEQFAQEFIASGAVAESDEVRLLPGWRSPDVIKDLSFGAVRRVLLDLVDGKAPRDLPPGDTDDLARSGFGVLLGLRIDWDIPIWEQIEAAGGLPEEPDKEAAKASRTAAFNTWRSHIFHESQGCVPVGLVPLSQVANEIAAFLAEAGEQAGWLTEIREFIEACRRGANDADIVCHPQIIASSLELSIYTEAGQFLDRLTIPENQLPIPAQDVRDVIASFVRLVQDRPESR